MTARLRPGVLKKLKRSGVWRAAHAKRAPKRAVTIRSLSLKLAAARARANQATRDIALATEIASKVARPGQTGQIISVPIRSGRFVQLVSVQAGYASILHALDDQGQVWMYQLKARTWTQVPMDKGELVPYVKDKEKA